MSRCCSSSLELYSHLSFVATSHEDLLHDMQRLHMPSVVMFELRHSAACCPRLFFLRQLFFTQSASHEEEAPPADLANTITFLSLLFDKQECSFTDMAQYDVRH